MNEVWLPVAGAASGFALVFGTGYWLALVGRPYGAALFAVHKLIGLGMLVYLGLSAYGFRSAALGRGVWLVVAMAILAFIVVIASGGVLSAVDPAPALASILHKVVPYITVVLTAVLMYLRMSVRR